jgi:hypothetical protein
MSGPPPWIGYLLPDEPRPARRHEEADLQAQVMEYLRWALPADAVAHHSPGEGKRSLRAQRDLKRSGYQAGWPDIEIVWRGHPHIFIELKAARGTLSEVQRRMHIKLTYCGAEVIIAKSLPAIECALCELGMPLRARIAA